MKKILVGVLVLCFAFLAGCGKKNLNNLEIVALFESKNAFNNMCKGVYNDMIFAVQNFPDKFAMQFLDMTGKEVKKFDIKRGKGPGELMHALFARINNDFIYIADFALKRLNKFDMDGKFIESIEFSEETGIIVSAEVVGDYLYFHSLQNIYFGKMNITTGKIEKFIPHPKTGNPVNGELIDAVYVKYDQLANKFYLGHMNMPYKIDIYNDNLEKESEITYEVKGDVKPMKWFITERQMDPIGAMMITSMAYDEKYIYAPIQSTQTDIKNDKFYLDPIQTGVLVFDKITHKCVAVLKNERFEGTEGEFNVVGVTKDYIVIEDVDNNFVVKGLLNDPKHPVGVEAHIFAVCKKPQDPAAVALN